MSNKSTLNLTRRYTFLLLAWLFCFHTHAQVVINPEQVTLPLKTSLKDALGRDRTTLTTAQIKDSSGKLAKGLHSVDFTLDAAAAYSLVVDGTTVAPGQKVTFSKNLSLSASAITFSMWPAVSGVAGTAAYTINIADIKVSVCPVGMTETVTHCQQILFEAPTYGCDAGYTLSGNICTKTLTIPKSSTCAAGFKQTGFDCTGGPKVDVLPVCSAGFSPNAAGDCEAIKYTTYSVCPDGFKDVVTHCEKVTTANKVNSACPADFTESEANAAVCSKTEQVLKSFYCEGTESTGTEQCVDGGSDKVCKRFDADKAACEIKTYSNKEPTCGEHYNLVNGYCELDIKYSINFTCPATYNYVPGTDKCEKTQSVAATPQCPSGFTLTGSSCSKSESIVIESCPAGYYYVNSKCSSMVTANATCASGYTWNGTTCTKNETSAATGVCNSPYTWNGSQCVYIDYQNATYGCPENYTYDGYYCNSPYTTGGSPGGWRCPAGYAFSSFPTGPNQMVCYETPKLICPSGYANHFDDPTLCQNYVDATSKVSGVCPGSHPFQYTDYTNLCTTTAGKRYSYSQSDAQTSCPAGSSKHSAYGCYANSPSPSEGYTSGQPKLTYNYSTYKMDGILVSYKGYQCSSGYELNGGSCEKSDTKSPSGYSCPSGWSVNGTQCTRTVTTTETRSCNSGYSLATPTHPTQCYNNAASNNVGNCKAGYSLSGTVCNGTVTQNATYSCSSGWTLNNDQCTKATTSTATPTCGNPFADAGANCTLLLNTVKKNLCLSPHFWSETDNQCKAVITSPKL